MKTERQKDLVGLTSYIKEEAQRLGFALVGGVAREGAAA